MSVIIIFKNECINTFRYCPISFKIESNVYNAYKFPIESNASILVLMKKLFLPPKSKKLKMADRPKSFPFDVQASEPVNWVISHV